MAKELTTKTIPSLTDLYEDKALINKQNQLNIILNAEPKKEWVQVHPIVKNKYLPIERIEYLLTMIFTKWRVEIKEVKILANSIVTTVRVHVKDPLTGEWDYQDGVGAMPIQISKEAGSAIAFDKMNSSAIQIGSPASESFAIKDACEKFGRIFGKDLNRKDNVNYDRLYQLVGMNEIMNNPSLTEEVRQEVIDCTTLEQLKKVEEKHTGLGKDFIKLVVEQKKFIEEVKKDEKNS